MFLSVAMCFKNESHILEEWINHYIDEGVDQFVLCDNNSTDDYESILNKFDNIVLFKDDSPSVQIECNSPMSAYGSNIYSKMISDTESEWYIIVDADEFMYSRGQYKTIRDFLKQRGSEFNQLLVPTPQFHNKWPNEVQEQPESVIDTFTESCHNFITKSIIKKEYLTKCYLHEHKVKGRSTRSHLKDDFNLGDRFDWKYKNVWRTYPDGEVFVHCNHYRFQSKDFFLKVKQERGWADGPGYGNNDRPTGKRNRLNQWHSANALDYNDDFELKNKKKMYKRK